MTVYDIVLFLDADTLVNNALDSILDLDLQGKTIGVTNSEEIFWDEHPLDQINVIHYTMKKPWKCKGKDGTYGPICKVWQLYNILVHLRNVEQASKTEITCQS